MAKQVTELLVMLKTSNLNSQISSDSKAQSFPLYFLQSLHGSHKNQISQSFTNNSSLSSPPGLPPKLEAAPPQ